MPTKLHIISLGGSLIVPGEIDWEYLKKFKKVIEEAIGDGHKFIIITGGGKLARNYIEAASRISDISSEDCDWMGIHATRLNGHLIRTIFKENAHPRINKNPHDLEGFEDFKEPIMVAAGWRPGRSTDFDAVLLAQYFKAEKVVNLSNIDFVYSDDPKKNPNAKPLVNMTWEEFRVLVGEKWDPGLNAPFDPVASKLGQEIGLEVAIMNGKNLSNFSAYLKNQPFQGTTIK